MRVKVINISTVEKAVNSPSNELIFCKTTAVDETGSAPVTWNLSSARKKGEIDNITHVMMCFFNYKRVVPICEEVKMEMNISDEVLIAIRSTIKAKKLRHYKMACFTKTFAASQVNHQ